MTDPTSKPLNIIRMKRLAEKIGLGESTIFRKIAAGEFPKPFPIGQGRAVGWRESDVDEWIERQATGTAAARRR
jgi:prophage regulatory protein